MIYFVSRPRESRKHILICHPPISAVDIEIFCSILEENTYRFGFGLSYQGCKFIPAAKTDICTDGAKNSSKLIRSFPSYIESTDCAGAGPCYRPIVRILAYVIGSFNLWK